MKHQFLHRTVIDTRAVAGRRRKIHQEITQGPTTQRSIVLVEEIVLHIDNTEGDGKRNEEALNYVII